MSNKVYVGQKCASFESKGEFPPVSRVTMHVDDEHYFTAGDDTGRTIELTCRAATQKIVDNILEKLRGFVYRPYEAKGAVLDPRVELGDAVTIGGIYSIIASRTTNLATPGISDISAPGALETGHEYKYLTPTERELKKRIKEGYKYQGVQIDRLNGLTITETDGETQGAKVVLNSKELTFYDVGGGKVLYFDPVSKTYKFMGELNVNDKFIVDKLGNVTIGGNIYMSDGNIIWGKNAPTKKQFSVSASGPWHSDMKADDKWRQDWDYSASPEGWGPAYQFKGVDGKDGANGSDATVPKYITETVISKGVIMAPEIIANEFKVTPGDTSKPSGGFVLYGAPAGVTTEMFRIKYAGADPGTIVTISSPADHVYWEPPNTDFAGQVSFVGDVDFRLANSVKGITATFA